MPAGGSFPEPVAQVTLFERSNHSFGFESLNEKHPVQWFDVIQIVVRPTDYSATHPDLPDLAGDDLEMELGIELL